METKIDYDWFKEELLQSEIVRTQFDNREYCIVKDSVSGKWCFLAGNKEIKEYLSFNDMMSEKENGCECKRIME